MDAHYRFIGTAGSICYLETDRDAPRGCVIEVDLASPERERWRLILPEQEESMAFSTLAGVHLLVVSCITPGIAWSCMHSTERSCANWSCLLWELSPASGHGEAILKSS